MKKQKYGPSLYYATDKNIFDALNQHKVDSKTVVNLFERRNIIASSETNREDLAKYFSRLPHDYYDHQDISSKLGIIPRRERVTSLDVKGDVTFNALEKSINIIKKQLEAQGDVVHISRNNENVTVQIQYSQIDYKRQEFTQVQIRDGTIEFVKSEEGYVVRSNQNDYISEVRDMIVSEVQENSEGEVERESISLFDIPLPKLRSKFFHELANNIDGYKKVDVTDVHVFKPKPLPDPDDEDSEYIDSHVEKVFLKGNEVTRSQILNDLLNADDYYIVRIRWTAEEKLKRGYVFDIEAVFDDPKDCSKFSFMLKGVFERDAGVLSSKKRAPNKGEIETISKVVELKSRMLKKSLLEEYMQLPT